VIANARWQNKAYIGIDNPLHVFVEGHSCSSLFVTTDNGKIERTGCYFNFRPAQLCRANLSIYRKQNGKSKRVRAFHWEVVPFPKPTVQVGSYENGSNVPRGGFYAQAGVTAFVSGLGFELMFKVVSFSFIIMRDSTVKFSTQIIGNSFTTNRYEAWKAIQPGSVVLITNIWVRGAEGKDIKTDRWSI
jgi:hypothetical protein